jgi:amphi-Trp domain-containing protein
MPEEVIFESERPATRADVADYLRTVADRLDADDPVTLRAGDDEVTLDPPGRLTFEVKAERETGGGPPELGVEFELEWREGTTSGDLDIS